MRTSMSPEERRVSRRDATRRYRLKNPDKSKASSLKSSRRWNENNPEEHRKRCRDYGRKITAADPQAASKRNRAKHLASRYGITPEDYERMLAAQGGHCRLCDRTPDQEVHGVLSVDHCYETKRIRGLLCHTHNTAIGQLGDTAADVQRVLQYLTGEAA